MVCTTQWRPTNNFLLPELTAWRPFRAQNIRTSDPTRFLATKYCVWRGVLFSKKIFPPKNLIYIFWRENISYFHFLSLHHRLPPLPFSSPPPTPTSFLLASPPLLPRNFAADILVLDTRCLCCCCCLRILELSGLQLLGRRLVCLLRE